MFPDFPNNYQAALYYAGLGMHVFPCYSIVDGGCRCGQSCRSPGKHPMTRDGFKSATTDPDTIKSWWERWPAANIGIRTGTVSGIWVLDLDGPAGIAALAELEAKHGCLPKTLTALTGGGGKHLYFKTTNGLEIKNRTKVAGLSIDVRGEGGYVIAPPSNHVSGNLYKWEV